MSVAQCPFGREATEGKTCTCGRAPAATFAHLPAFELKEALDSVLALTQRPGNGAITGIRQAGGHALDPRRQVLVDSRLGSLGLIAVAASRDARPATDLHHTVTALLSAAISAMACLINCQSNRDGAAAFLGT